MIPYSRQNITESDLSAVSRVLKSDFLTQGPQVEAFEDALKVKFSVNYAVLCSSGTAALHLSYASIGVGPKTIGIVPAITFAATANAFRYLGAEVRFCDVDDRTGLLCLSSLEEILRDLSLDACDCPGVISPVSFAGATAPLADVQKCAKKYGFRVVEDASHSPGSFIKNSRNSYRSATCEYSDTACLSFHPVKHICCGEGGAVLTNDKQIGETARKLSSHGIVRSYDKANQTPWFYEQTELGWNYRLTDIQAVLGKSQLSRLDEQLEIRRKLASIYDQAFSQSPFKDCFECPVANIGHAWHLYIIRFKKAGLRDKAYRFLKNKGIMTQIHYIPVYRHPYYEKRYGELRLPGAEKFYHSCLSIPMFPTLSDEKQKEVIKQIGIFCEKSS